MSALHFLFENFFSFPPFTAFVIPAGKGQMLQARLGVGCVIQLTHAPPSSTPRPPTRDEEKLSHPDHHSRLDLMMIIIINPANRPARCKPWQKRQNIHRGFQRSALTAREAQRRITHAAQQRQCSAALWKLHYDRRESAGTFPAAPTTSFCCHHSPACPHGAGAYALGHARRPRRLRASM